MKRIETSRIRNGQSRVGDRVESESRVLGPVGWHATVTDDRSQTWGQEIWPDCLD